MISNKNIEIILFVYMSFCFQVVNYITGIIILKLINYISSAKAVRYSFISKTFQHKCNKIFFGGNIYQI
jgi:hypothetical protein